MGEKLVPKTDVMSLSSVMYPYIYIYIYIYIEDQTNGLFNNYLLFLSCFV